jgi:hypothetical protein
MQYWNRLPHGAAYTLLSPALTRLEADPFNEALSTLNNLFTALFLIEMLLKFSAWGIQQ